MDEFEWDEDNEFLHFQKHRIDFTTTSRIWERPVFERIDDRRDYGEVRFQAFGIVENHILTVVYTWRGEARRIISARRANAREKRLFEAEICKRGRPPPN
jgi:uncharacterized DUF497 family protein